VVKTSVKKLFASADGLSVKYPVAWTTIKLSVVFENVFSIADDPI